MDTKRLADEFRTESANIRLMMGRINEKITGK
jgi:hypothetical protein